MEEIKLTPVDVTAKINPEFILTIMEFLYNEYKLYKYDYPRPNLRMAKEAINYAEWTHNKMEQD